MADLKLSGYKASASSVAWTTGTDFDSLADNGWTSLSDEIDNSTNLYMYADLVFDLGSAAYTGTDSKIEIFLIPLITGTTYPTWTTGTSDEQENQQYAVGEVFTTGTTAVQDIAYRNILLPNNKFKWAFRNRTGVTSAASNTIQWRPHQLQI